MGHHNNEDQLLLLKNKIVNLEKDIAYLKLKLANMQNFIVKQAEDGETE